MSTEIIKRRPGELQSVIEAILKRGPTLSIPEIAEKAKISPQNARIAYRRFLSNRDIKVTSLSAEDCRRYGDKIASVLSPGEKKEEEGMKKHKKIGPRRRRSPLVKKGSAVDRVLSAAASDGGPATEPERHFVTLVSLIGVARAGELVRLEGERLLRACGIRLSGTGGAS